MEQLGRRLVYLSLGLVPACLGTVFSFFLGPLMLVALAGTFGLFIATAAEFPVQGKRYWFLASLLVCGLALALPFAIFLPAGLLKDGLSREDLPTLLLVLWIFVCPSACALHALWHSRRAPNNSFKPSPLRGLGPTGTASGGPA